MLGLGAARTGAILRDLRGERHDRGSFQRSWTARDTGVVKGGVLAERGWGRGHRLQGRTVMCPDCWEAGGPGL